MTTKHTDEKQPAPATTPLPPRPGEIQSINEPPPPEVKHDEPHKPVRHDEDNKRPR